MKVKITILFRYLQLRRPELGAEILDDLVAACEGLASVETRTRLESRRMTMVLAPLPKEKQQLSEQQA
jgi:translation initiation factor IF-3